LRAVGKQKRCNYGRHFVQRCHLVNCPCSEQLHSPCASMELKHMPQLWGTSSETDHPMPKGMVAGVAALKRLAEQRQEAGRRSVLQSRRGR
jgi:hypothetical protein